MSGGDGPEVTPNRDDLVFGDMLLRVRVSDPAADAEAVRRYAREIAEADAVLQTLDLDPSSTPLVPAFSPAWDNGRPR